MTTTSRNHKPYPLDQSPLYKLQTKRKLASIFNTPINDLKMLVSKTDNYRLFTVGKEQRPVQEPKPQLKRIHRRLFTLLKRIQTPEYLHSGIKGKSYITNAKEHIGSDTLLSLDIQKFFPSTLGWHVFDFFYSVMHCSRDVAYLLTEISTYNNHVPTGSCLSQIIAFYAHKAMFEEIHDYTSSLDLKMTCYVDDIAISGKNANRLVLFNIKGILIKSRLKSHPKKERIFQHGSPKEVTGSIVLRDCLKLPNRKHKQIHEEIITISKLNESKDKRVLINKTIGRVNAASQSDPEMIKNIPALLCAKNRVENLVDN